MGAVILIFVEGFDSGDIFEGYFFCGFLIDFLVLEGVKAGSGEDDPASFPLLEKAGALEEEALFNFGIADFML